MGKIGNGETDENIDNSSLSLSLSLSLPCFFDCQSIVGGCQFPLAGCVSLSNVTDNRFQATEHECVSEGSAASVQQATFIIDAIK